MITEQQVREELMRADMLGISAPWHGTYRMLLGVIDSERDAYQKTADALRSKDAAMGVLLERLTKAGVDCSDLIP